MNNKIEEEFKPRTWLLIVLIVIALGIVVVLANKIVLNRQEKQKEGGGIFNIFSNIFEQIEKEDASMFNFSFEAKSGTKWGSVVCSLLDEVVTNNKTNKDHIITVVYGEVITTDSNEIISLKGNFDNRTDYEVSLDYDEDGFVNKVTIMNLKVSAESFNSSLKSISGTTSRSLMSSSIDKVLDSNRDNSEHLITVCYQGTCTSDDSEIREIKKKFTEDIPMTDPNWFEKTTKDYDVILSYDDAGYINKVTIEE